MQKVFILFQYSWLTKTNDTDKIFTVLNLKALEDTFSGPGRSEEMDTLLFQTPDKPDCTLRLCGLQKLKVCTC